MEVYLKKKDLPKNCFHCPCFNHDFMNCDLDDEDKGYFLDEIDGGKCPLKTIDDKENEQLKADIKELKIINAEIFDDNKKLEKETEELKEKYDNLYKCYQKTSQEDLKDKYGLAEEIEKLKEKLNNPHDVWVENNTLTEINNWQNNEIIKLNNQLKEKENTIDCLIKARESDEAFYTKQVCKKIKDLAGDYFEFGICENCGEQISNDVILSGKDLTEILNQVGRGEE